MKVNKKKSKKRNSVMKNHAEDPSKLKTKTPSFKQLPGENEKAFVTRMNDHVEYMKIHTDPRSNEDIVKKSKKNRRLNSRKTRRKKLLETLRENKAEKEMWKDNVKFGEVVLKPPELRAKPKNSMRKPPTYSNLNFMKNFDTKGSKLVSKAL